MPDHTPVAAVYEERHRDRLIARDRHALVSRRLGWVRLAVFGAALVAVWAATSAGSRALPFGILASLLILVFVWLVRRHRQEKRQVEWLGALARVNGEAAARARREWRDIPDTGWPAAEADHPYADDLDVFGSASLSQLLPPTSAAPGCAVLRSWILAPADVETIRERQAAVAELAPQLDFRDGLTALGRRIWLGRDALGALEQWAVGEGWLAGRPLLVAASVALTAANVVLILLAIGGLIPSGWWVASVAVSIALSARFSTPLRRTLAPVADKADALGTYSEMSHLVVSASFTSPLLVRLQAAMTLGDLPARDALASLRRLADCSQVRSSPMLYLVLQSLFLWDFHVARVVERWQRRHGRHVAPWLAALGEVESLAALAALAHGNPTWTFPDVDERHPALEATALGHPLLADDVVVRNDVTVGPSGTFLLVTGSNMAGKSTLLRAIGLNVVLAQAGAPVCATSLRLPPLSVHTSMRLRDSLAQGVSYFMAEVLRLKRIVDAARIPSAQRVLYLFDEMLQGTNAAERTVAAQSILLFLASTTAIGALATHDLRLLDSPEVARDARLVHFREEVVGAEGTAALHFDYRLRPGPASSTNALKLMELAGLPIGSSA